MLFRNDPYSRGTRTSYRIALIDAMRHFLMAPFFLGSAGPMSDPGETTPFDGPCLTLSIKPS